MEIKAVIDRFEGSKAVLLVGASETGVNWPRELLPETKEGDILSIQVTVDVEATKQARAEAEALFEQIIRQQDNNK